MRKPGMIFVVLLILQTVAGHCATLPLSDFARTLRTVDSLYIIRTGAHAHLKFKKIVQKDKRIDFHFTQGIEDFPVRRGDYAWLKKQLQENLPLEYEEYKVGRLLYRRETIDKLATSAIGNNGTPASGIKIDEHGPRPLASSDFRPNRGLYGRNIAMWQSHGHYYSQKDSCWKWQRDPLFQTCEDVFTQSFVVPFLSPMLENAGAGVFLPRERDWQTTEIIIDNDPCEQESGRLHGVVDVPQGWTESESGFRDSKAVYTDEDNPFLAGTFLWNKCTGNRKRSSFVRWKAAVPARGEYAVYVTYTTLPSSCTEATYTVHALGGDRNITVDQSIGGGIWIYLGTFEFDSGERQLVSLSNFSGKNGVVTADAVKIGGGYGNISRFGETSGRPRFTEGARYNMQWSGIPSKVWSQNEGLDDYRDDLMSRGKWVQHLSGGSWLNPKGKGLGIPIDLSLAFHTDAGIFPNDSIVGTLAIYTLKCDGRTTFPNRESRKTGRELADFIQSQIVSDLQQGWNPGWRRRQLWNRSYSESRTTGVPGMLLELLSHQNFEDMKYGNDPLFKFHAARACYKGILKYLSMRYNNSYTVQPLPVQGFSVALGDTQGNEGTTLATLRWKERPDPLEPTATASYFILQTRMDDGGWDKGERISPSKTDGCFCLEVPVKKGHIYSFRIVAGNEGGISFPSETLAVGIPGDENAKERRKILIVNNFTRISGPVWFDSPIWAGFDNASDSGVPYIRDWSFSGVQTCFDRKAGNDFGKSGDEMVDVVISGNTFDYPYIHGKALMANGFAFESCSSSAFRDGYAPAHDNFAIDLICGKQCQVRTAGRTASRDAIFPSALQERIEKCSGEGCHIIISGSYIGHDAVGHVYPLDSTDLNSPSRTAAKKFIGKVLGYGLRRAYASKSGVVTFTGGKAAGTSVHFPVTPCGQSYCVESPDALSPVAAGSGVKSSAAFMKYGDSSLPAATITDFGGYKVAAFGFPIEILSSREEIENLFRETLELLR